MPTTPATKYILSVLLSSLILTEAKDVRATEPGAWTFGVSPVYSYFIIEGNAKPEGGGAAILLRYQLTSAISLHLSGVWSGHHIEGTEDDAGGLYQFYNGAAGLGYSFDVVSLSPVIEGGFGFLHQKYHESSATDLGLQIGLSIDYYFWGWLGVGAVFHYHAFLSNPTKYPVYFDAGPRLSLRFKP